MAEHGCKPSMSFDVASADTAMFNHIVSNHVFHLTGIDPTLNENLIERDYTDAECDAGFTATVDTLHAIAWVGGSTCNITFPDNVKSGDSLVFYFTAGLAGTSDLIFTCGTSVTDGQQTHFTHQRYIHFDDTMAVVRGKYTPQTTRDVTIADVTSFSTVEGALKLTIASDGTNNQFGGAAYISFMYHDGDHARIAKGWTIGYVPVKQGTGAKPTKFDFSTS